MSKRRRRTQRPPTYSFEEFGEHFLNYGDFRHRNPVTSYEHGVIQLYEFLAPQYADDEERLFKGGRFMLMMSYLVEHIDDFDCEDFAVEGSPAVGGLVSTHLLRAIHHFFTEKSLSELGYGPSPDDVKALARQYKADSESEPTTPEDDEDT